MAKRSKEADVNATVKAARKAAADASSFADQIQYDLARFRAGDKLIDLNVDTGGETMWATVPQIADLFGRDAFTIETHIKNIYESNELERPSTTSKFEVVRYEGDRAVKRTLDHYNLDVIISVGYRVQSPTATAFRQWATKTLRSYVVDGYVINESRLRSDPAATNKLAAKLREIRSDEKNIYASVRDFFREASSDYNASSKLCHAFFAKLQDKFHFAITNMTASQILLGRADHKKAAMGLTNFEGNIPTISEARIAKNYLESDELYTLHILSEQFLLYVQSKAIRGKPMTMAELDKKLDELLKVNDYPIFNGYKDYIKDKAIKHANAEYLQFTIRLKKEDRALVVKPSRQ